MKNIYQLVLTIIFLVLTAYLIYCSYLETNSISSLTGILIIFYVVVIIPYVGILWLEKWEKFKNN